MSIVRESAPTPVHSSDVSVHSATAPSVTLKAAPCGMSVKIFSSLLPRSKGVVPMASAGVNVNGGRSAGSPGLTMFLTIVSFGSNLLV